MAESDLVGVHVGLREVAVPVVEPKQRTVEVQVAAGGQTQQRVDQIAVKTVIGGQICVGGIDHGRGQHHVLLRFVQSDGMGLCHRRGVAATTTADPAGRHNIQIEGER